MYSPKTKDIRAIGSWSEQHGARKACINYAASLFDLKSIFITQEIILFIFAFISEEYFSPAGQDNAKNELLLGTLMIFYEN